MSAEEALPGGNTTVVVRVGDTVRRPVGAWTPAVHDLLAHLERVGFEGAPKVLGVDEREREVLDYVPGEAGTLSPDSPLPPWFRTDEACWTIGRWIRAFQRAQRDFRPDASKPWRRAPGSDWRPDLVLVHHDVSPYNTVRRDDGSVVVLDWDFVRPGNPIDDLAWAAWRWTPLMTGSWWHRMYGIHDESEVLPRQRDNLAALLEGYAPSADQRARLAAEIHRQITEHAADLEDMARTDPAFAALVNDGHAASAREDAQWWRVTGNRAVFGGA